MCALCAVRCALCVCTLFVRAWVFVWAAFATHLFRRPTVTLLSLWRPGMGTLQSLRSFYPMLTQERLSKAWYTADALLA